MESIKNIPLEKIHDHDDDELVESIRYKGIINPIIIRENYQIIDGRERYKAAKFIGLKTIPCLIITEQELKDIQIIASKHRIPTDPIEYSRQLHRFFKLNPNMTIADLAIRLNKSVEWVQEKLNLTTPE